MLSPVRRVSTLMNHADGSWNFGESPDGIDIGGAHGQDPLTATMPTYEPHPAAPADWHQPPIMPPVSVVQYIGRLRPPQGNRGPDGEFPAAFLVVAPTVMNRPYVVIWLLMHTTFGAYDPSEIIRQPHNYPGGANNYDLLSVGVETEFVLRNMGDPTLPFHLVGLQYVPRCSQRPLLSTLQRARQVVKAAIHLIKQRYGTNDANIAVCVSCISYGGLTAPLAALFYPTEFHAAMGAAYSGAHRSMPSDLDSHTFSTSLLGLDVSANGYNMRDTVDFGMFCSVEDTDYASISFTNRWVKGHLQRPVYFLIGDEDTVSHGTDWCQILTGNTDPFRKQPQGGTESLTNVFDISVDVFWTIVNKVAHSEPRMNLFKVEGVTPPIFTTDLNVPQELMFKKAYEELLDTSRVIYPIDDAQLGRKLTDPNLPSQDPNRIALGHRGARTPTPGSNQNFLTLNANFKRYGQGTWLGANESLKVKQLPGEDRASVFVGSADGYVTRLKMAGVPASNPVAQPLVEVARSNKPLGTPYALGYGTWGLDVGDIDPLNNGWEVAVASYDRVALFDAATLTWLREVHLANWEYTNPRKLQVADVHGGNTAEIVFRTMQNRLVIMDHNLAILYEHREGGVIDLAIGPQPTARAPNALKRPIYLLSARGHVVRLEINTGLTQDNAGMLAGVSPLQYGGLRDLDIVTYQGQERLGVLVMPHEGTTDAMRLYDVVDCNRVAEFGDLMRNPPSDPPMSAQHASPSGDMEPSFTSVGGHGGERFVISCGGSLSVWDGEIVLGHKSLSEFVPTRGHGCVQAGNIDPTTPGDEVVVSTMAGRVVWFKLSDLTTPGLAFTGTSFDRNHPSHFVFDQGVLHEDRCNMTLAATWPMAGVAALGTTPGKLHAIDHGHTWWEVDPLTGTPTRARDLVLGAASLIPLNAPGRVWIQH